MDRRTPLDHARLTAALSRVPDEPRWVDTRGMLLSGRATVHAAPGADLARDSFAVVVADASLAGVVGDPSSLELGALVRSMRGDVNVLAQNEDSVGVGATLGGWKRRAAILHVLPGAMDWESQDDPSARVFTRETAPRLDHVDEGLRREIVDALAGRTTARFVPGALPEAIRITSAVTVPVGAVWAERFPVAFCYPVWQTETWWDVSIDTLREYRKRGYGGRAARALIRHMLGQGRAPVWGALETNAASRALAARLGFIEAAGIAVFTAR